MIDPEDPAERERRGRDALEIDEIAHVATTRVARHVASRPGSQEVAGDGGPAERLARIAHDRDVTGDERLRWRARIDADETPVADRVGRARKAREVRLHGLDDEAVGSRGRAGHGAIDRHEGAAGQRSSIHRVGERLPVVPEHAKVDDQRSEPEDDDEEHGEDDEDLPALSFASPPVAHLAVPVTPGPSGRSSPVGWSTRTAAGRSCGRCTPRSRSGRHPAGTT